MMSKRLLEEGYRQEKIPGLCTFSSLQSCDGVKELTFWGKLQIHCSYIGLTFNQWTELRTDSLHPATKKSYMLRLREAYSVRARSSCRQAGTLQN